jgi:hypothetical protein
MIKKITIAVGLFLLPSFAFAQLTGITNIVDSIRLLIESLIPLFFALILLAFFYGLARYLYAVATGNDAAGGIGKGIMLGGILALFVAASIWGIVFFIQELFEIENIEEWPAPRVAD